MGKQTANYLERWSSRTDNRIRFMNEILSGIQVIKMYAWEKSFVAMVAKLRKKEVNAIRGFYYLGALFSTLYIVSKISILLTILSYLYLNGTIIARKVFIIMSLFSHLNFTMVYFWPCCIRYYAETLVAMRRIQTFLEQSEEKPSKNENIENEEKFVSNDKSDFIKKLDIAKPPKVERRMENINSNLKNVILKNMSAAWSEKDANLGVFDINLEVNARELCMVVGSVGSGKSSLLNAIIGELEIDDGSAEINGIISYAAQEPWLFDGSIKSNIVFIEDFDEIRYREVCRICALERDFQLLPHGDNTIVGEKGVILSGGQKARVSLARTVYKNADIYILDDPLSAVDAHVGQHIFEECIQEFLKNKCVILVTHQLQFTRNIKHIVVLSNGRISSEGEFSEDKIASISRQQSEETENTATEDALIDEPHEESFKLPDPDEEEEEFVRGKIGFDILKSYVSAANKYLVIFVIIMCILDQIALSGVDYMLSLYIDWEESIHMQTNVTQKANSLQQAINETFDDVLLNSTFTNLTASYINVNEISNNPIESQRHSYVMMYVLLIVICICFKAIRHTSYFTFAVKASINLHNNLFSAIIRAKMRFFHKNSSGRILNRFSRDVNTIDYALPQSASDSSVVCICCDNLR